MSARACYSTAYPQDLEAVPEAVAALPAESDLPVPVAAAVPDLPVPAAAAVPDLLVPAAAAEPDLPVPVAAAEPDLLVPVAAAVPDLPADALLPEWLPDRSEPAASP